MTSRRAVLRLLSLAAACGGPVLKQTAYAGRARDTSAAALRPSGLRVEWRDSPSGVDTRKPRFSWLLTGAGQSQSACRVVVASSRGDVWDSGKRLRAESSLYPDDDLELPSQTLLHWSVAVWDQHDRPAWGEPAAFLSGIFQSEDWRASWIAAVPDRSIPPGPPAAINTDPPVEPRPLPLFRRNFAVNRPLERAVVCVSGLGQYELRLNGRGAGTGVLNPGWTDYGKTVLYNTFDVTRLVRRGGNSLGVLLGNGMYNVEKYPGRYTKRVGSFGQPKLILQLKLRFTDGSEQLIVSDSSWKTRPGPIVVSHPYGGEDFDARLETDGWDLYGSDVSGWQPVLTVAGPGGILRAQNVPPVEVARTLTPVVVSEPRPGIRIYDLGENFSGWPKIEVRGPAGRRVKLLPGELLDDAGLVTQHSANARPGNEVSYSYTTKGKGKETWHPRFTYYGFRYVQVEGAGGDVELISLQGEFLHASLPPGGHFECSNPLLVRIHRLITQALLSNTMSVLTDCPQREKLGWLEQTHLNADTVFYNQDAVTLYEKMLRDMQDSQLENGMVPEIAPEYVAFLNADGTDSIFRDSPEWGAALVLSPWAAFRYTGDLRILEHGYDSMQRYAGYLSTRLQDGLLNFGLGDWYDIGPKPPGAAQLTSRTLTGTAIYCEVLLTLSRIARSLGYEADEQRHASQAREAIRTFNARLFDPDTNRYDHGSMTANAMPLAIGLVPDDRRAAVLANLVADIRSHQNHVTCGDVGFHYVVLALLENGRGDVLYDILTRSDPPSYGSQLTRGATALTEAWDANPNHSQNHFMLGHAETWLYGGLGGLRIDCSRDPDSRIRIAPQAVHGVESASVRYHSVWGEIVSSWRRTGGALHLHVEIPPGVTARIQLPGDEASSVVGSGQHDFTVRERPTGT